MVRSGIADVRRQGDGAHTLKFRKNVSANLMPAEALSYRTLIDEVRRAAVA
jgi:hypothetical protein